MDRDASASSCPVWRSRRPHSRPRNFMHENRETSKTPAVQTDGRSVGEGLGRTARPHVSEESDRGIVPMNHSNKDGVSSAESEEGRLRITDQGEHFPLDTHPTPSGTACVPSFPSRQESAVNYLFANVRGSTRAAIAIVDRQSALTSDQDSRKTLTPSKGAITWTLLLS